VMAAVYGNVLMRALLWASPAMGTL
jgi:hypothetical protein